MFTYAAVRSGCLAWDADGNSGYSPFGSTPFVNVDTTTVHNAGSVTVTGIGRITVGTVSTVKNAGSLTVTGVGRVTVGTPYSPLSGRSYSQIEQTFDGTPYAYWKDSKQAAITLSALNLIDSGSGYYTVEPGSRDAGFVDQTGYFTVEPGTTTDLLLVLNAGQVVIY